MAEKPNDKNMSEELEERTVAVTTASVVPNEDGAAALQAEPAESVAEPAQELGEEEETYKEISPMRLVLRRFFRSKLSIVGLVMIAFLFVFSFLGPVFCEWGEDEVDMTPTEFTYEFSYTYTDENGETVKVLEEYTYIGEINTYADPSSGHLLGTDDKGFDVFVRLMYGGRISLMIGFIVVILETIIGIVLGGIAGYFGGWVDQLIMRIVDIFNCIPTLPILLIASAVIDSWQLTADQQIYVLMVVITLFSWSGVARLVRGQIISLREQEYMTATEVMGLPTWRKIFKHLIPNVMPQLIVSMTLGLGSVILYESTLSYLGLGVQLPKAAWGTMISQVNDPVIFQYHVNVWLPAGILIVIAVLGFNFIGDGLRDAMDPKARK
ncbi:MAG: ABC transporter permease [Clostridiales bacterium]|nr:ABC transporter permease [Clostridiales bacterium]